MNEIAVVGVGNPHRGDDAAGWLVIDALEKDLNTRVPLFRTDAEMTRILEHLRSANKLILIDALFSGASPPGTLHRIDGLGEELPLAEARTSSHSGGIVQSIGMARALGGLPERLEIIGIESRQFGHGEPPGSEVLKGVEQARDCVKGILKEWNHA